MSRTVTGTVFGIAMLKTGFPRPVGDIGNPASFTSPVLYETVAQASVAPVTAKGGPDETLLEPFLERLSKLASGGATILGTSCGFLTPFQDRLAAGLDKPFLSSSLMALPFLEDRHGGQGKVGVLTFRAENLGPAHFKAAGSMVPPTVGLPPDGHLARVIAEDRPDFNQDAAERDVTAAARSLARKNPQLRAILFECTNLGPYRRSVETETGLPVFDVVWALEAFATGEFSV